MSITERYNTRIYQTKPVVRLQRTGRSTNTHSAHGRDTSSLTHIHRAKSSPCFGWGEGDPVHPASTTHDDDTCCVSRSRSGSRILLLAAIGRESKVISAAQVGCSAVRCAVAVAAVYIKHTQTHTHIHAAKIHSETQSDTFTHIRHYDDDDGQSIESDLVNSIVDCIRKRILICLPAGVVCIVKIKYDDIRPCTPLCCSVKVCIYPHRPIRLMCLMCECVSALCMCLNVTD